MYYSLALGLNFVNSSFIAIKFPKIKTHNLAVYIVKVQSVLAYKLGVHIQIITSHVLVPCAIFCVISKIDKY